MCLLIVTVYYNMHYLVIYVVCFTSISVTYYGIYNMECK
jgi:hypothetical protein